MNNFIDLFWVSFAEGGKKNYWILYLVQLWDWSCFKHLVKEQTVLIGCKISYLSNEKCDWMKLWNEVPPFMTAEKNGAAECIPTREEKSSNKFGLLPQKGNTSKWHSIQMFFNGLLTFCIHTAFRKSLWVVQNTCSKWLTHPFWHFSNCWGVFVFAGMPVFWSEKDTELTQLLVIGFHFWLLEINWPLISLTVWCDYWMSLCLILMRAKLLVCVV